MEVQGYLEAGGFITKVSSIEDIKNFIARCGRSVNEITEAELEQLTCYEMQYGRPICDYVDDCGAFYKTNPLIFLRGEKIVSEHMGSYKVLDGTIAICRNAFSYHDAKDRLQSIYMPNTVIVIGYSAFYGRSKLSCLSSSKTLIKIADNAFCGCSSLKALPIFPVLKYIGSHAFERSGLETITIPASTIKIGSCAFKDCQALTSVTFEGIPTTIGSDIFDGCISLNNINVPHGYRDYFVKTLYPLNKEIIKEV